MSKRYILFVMDCILLITGIACICTLLFQKEQDYMKKKWGKELENDKYFSSNYF